MTPIPSAVPVQDPGPRATPLVAASIALAAWVGALPLIWMGDTCTIMTFAVPVAGLGIYGACRMASAFRFSIVTQLIVAVGFFYFTMFAAAGRERRWFANPPDVCIVRVDAVAESIQRYKDSHDGHIPRTLDEIGGYGAGFRCPSGARLVIERHEYEWMVYCPEHLKSQKHVMGNLAPETAAQKR